MKSSGVFKAGEQIFTPFSDKSRVYEIEEGYVFAYTFDESGKRQIHLIYGPGCYFPVITAFKNREQRASYEALTNLELKVYSKLDFQKKVREDHKFTLHVLDKTVNQLSIFANRITELQANKLEDKIHRRLLNLAKEHGIKTKDGWKLPYKLKHHQLADVLGVERESLTRALNRLVKSGKLNKNGDNELVIMVTEQ